MAAKLVNTVQFQIKETHDRRARGGSKTEDHMIMALYLSIQGYHGIWFAAYDDQLDQPKIYFKSLILSTFLFYLMDKPSRDLSVMSVRFYNGGTLKLKNLTEAKARSSRADFLVYDEESQADPVAYAAAKNILAGSALALVFHISTPVKGSLFEDNYNRLKLREIKYGVQLCFHRSYEDIAYLARMTDFYEEEKLTNPKWYFDQEHRGIFVLPAGAVFKQVDFGVYPDWLMSQLEDYNCSGLDWNPAAGHWASSVKWTRDLKNVVVTGEFKVAEGYVATLTAEDFIKVYRLGTHGDRLNIESAGINEEYVTWFRTMKEALGYPDNKFSYEEWDNQGVAKYKAVTGLFTLGTTIWCDRNLYPTLAKQIEQCSWDNEHKGRVPQINKEKSNSPHALDAFLHAISEKNRDVEEYEMIDW